MRVARLLITWNRPYHLSDTEAGDWVPAELRRLAAIPDERRRQAMTPHLVPRRMS